MLNEILELKEENDRLKKEILRLKEDEKWYRIHYHEEVSKKNEREKELKILKKSIENKTWKDYLLLVAKKIEEVEEELKDYRSSEDSCDCRRTAQSWTDYCAKVGR